MNDYEYCWFPSCFTFQIPDLVGFIGEQVDWSFMDSVFEFSALEALGNFVFVAGGYDRNTYCSSTVCYRFISFRIIHSYFYAFNWNWKQPRKLIVGKKLKMNYFNTDTIPETEHGWNLRPCINPVSVTRCVRERRAYLWLLVSTIL